MEPYGKEELREAAWAVASTIGKSEKAKLKLKADSWQYRMTVQSLGAHAIALELINRALEADTAKAPAGGYPKAELEEALEAIAEVIGRVEKVLPKFEAGTPQHTLAVRRIKALQLSTALITEELGLQAGER